MNRLLAVFCLACIAQAQTLTIGSATGQPNSIVRLPLTLSGISGLTDLQFNFVSDKDIRVSVTVGPVALAASKSLTCNPISGLFNSTKCILADMNNKVLADGIVAYLDVSLPANLPARSGIQINGIVGGNLAAKAIPITGVSGVITNPNAGLPISRMGAEDTRIPRRIPGGRLAQVGGGSESSGRRISAGETSTTDSVSSPTENLGARTPAAINTDVNTSRLVIGSVSDIQCGWNDKRKALRQVGDELTCTARLGVPEKEEVWYRPFTSREDLVVASPSSVWVKPGETSFTFRIKLITDPKVPNRAFILAGASKDGSGTLMGMIPLEPPTTTPIPAEKEVVEMEGEPQT
jgi:hypothetical protein